jgi:hypothetical protein
MVDLADALAEVIRDRGAPPADAPGGVKKNYTELSGFTAPICA